MSSKTFTPTDSHKRLENIRLSRLRSTFEIRLTSTPTDHGAGRPFHPPGDTSRQSARFPPTCPSRSVAIFLPMEE